MKSRVFDHIQKVTDIIIAMNEMHIHGAYKFDFDSNEET